MQTLSAQGATMSNLPWWWPQRTDAKWCQYIRDTYPDEIEDGCDSDEDIRYLWANGRNFIDTWDHLGDAAEQWEEAAAFILKHFPDGPPENT